MGLEEDNSRSLLFSTVFLVSHHLQIHGMYSPEKRFKSIGQLVPSDVMFQVIKNDSQYEVFPRNVYTMAAYELGNTAMVRPVTPGFLEWEDPVIKMFEDIRNGADPEKTLDQMASRIDRTLAKYR